LNTTPHIEPLVSKKLVGFQVAVWIIFYSFLLLYTIQKWDQPEFGFWAATIATIFYVVAVYANAAWLIPRYYRKGKRGQYMVMAIAVLALLLFSRMGMEYLVLMPLHLKFYSWTLSHFSFVFITNFLAFAFGALLRVSLDYLVLLRQQEEMKARQLATELDLLKSQVQPHFLFNTLNNIYYLAYTKNERTPEVIAKLSDIMRYFLDEAPREKVPLATEIQFLKNYIELEQIRMLHPVKLHLSLPQDQTLMIPPMLLIPLVENIFKHGVDKTVEDNEAWIKLEWQPGKLKFTTSNRKEEKEKEKEKEREKDREKEKENGGGMGMKNLRKRLAILYGSEYDLQTIQTSDKFTVSMKIPV
jgi:sensor histidine kinase YesM